MGLESRIPRQLPSSEPCDLLWAKARADSYWLGDFCLGKAGRTSPVFSASPLAQMTLTPETVGLKSSGSQY